MKSTKTVHQLPIIMFVLALCVGAFVYGFLAHRNELFPYGLIREGFQGFQVLRRAVVGERFNFYFRRSQETRVIPVYDAGAVYPGLTLLTAVMADGDLAIQVVNPQGEVIHEWRPNWFEIYPEAPEHVSEEDLPQSTPGTHIHGVVLLEDGSVVFNFEHLSLVRLDPCGGVMWRLAYRTHHSLFLDEQQRLWASGQINHYAPVSRIPNHEPVFIEPTVVVVSLEGEILRTFSVMDILRDNGLAGLLYVSSQSSDNVVRGDTLHLNDVEVFPASLEPGVFEAGDIMLSLRNISTVLVVDGEDLSVKYRSMGELIRQHDPDFIDGNTLSIFNNNNYQRRNAPAQILIKSVRDGGTRVHYTGTESERFSTHLMGKHQWLPNGNLLISEPMHGRGFEIDPGGKIVWEYINLIDEGRVGILEELQRLPQRFDEAFFQERTRLCASPDRA